MLGELVVVGVSLYMNLIFLEESLKMLTWGSYLSKWKPFDWFGLLLTCGLGCCFVKSKLGIWIRSSMVALVKATSVTCNHFHLTSHMSFHSSN